MTTDDRYLQAYANKCCGHLPNQAPPVQRKCDCAPMCGVPDVPDSIECDFSRPPGKACTYAMREKPTDAP